MAKLPAKRFVRALAVGLALVGAAVVGPAAPGFSAGCAPASALVGVPAFEGPPPPPPDPIPIIDKPANRAPDDGQSPQPRYRRHHDNPVPGN
jgi:hypothetical protein